MVYDPIHGCVRDTNPFRRRPTSIDPFVLEIATRKEPVIRNGRLKFTIGTARSGKSTYCTRWAQFMEDHPTRWEDFFPRVIVCSDDIRLAMTGQRFNRQTEPAVWMINTYMVKALLSRGHDVIIDGTNTTEDSIWRILNINHEATFKVFDTDVATCEERALASGYTDLVEHGVIRRHAEQMAELADQPGGISGVVERIRQRVKDRWGIK